MNAEASDCVADPAAVFACAISLWEACLKREEDNPELNLSDAYRGMDQLMREVMRIGETFEQWACEHVEFDALADVWPYLLDERFGKACLEDISPGELMTFNSDDCLRVAYQLRIPMRADGTLPLPIDVRADNPIADSVFKEFRVQTVRDDFEGTAVVPFTESSDPFDEELGSPYCVLYGVGDDGLPEHIAERGTYAEALALAQKLAPGIAFPEVPVCFGGNGGGTFTVPLERCGCEERDSKGPFSLWPPAARKWAVRRRLSAMPGQVE